MLKKLNHILLATLATAILACKDESEPTPAYLELKPFEVTAPGGAAAQKLLFGWVYVGPEFLGAYSPGKPFPVLKEGEVEVTIFPGVNENGLQQTPEIYLPFKEFKTTVTLEPGKTTLIQPTTGYDAGATDPWGDRGQFDGQTLVFENLDTDPDNAIAFETAGAYDGRSAVLRVDTADWFISVATEWLAGLPTTGGKQTWLEMHYQCDVPFSIALLGKSALDESSQPVYDFRPKAEWNKIYINLTPFLAESAKTQYRLGIQTILPRDEKNQFTRLDAAVRFDNLKVVHL